MYIYICILYIKLNKPQESSHFFCFAAVCINRPLSSVFSGNTHLQLLQAGSAINYQLSGQPTALVLKGGHSFEASIDLE